MEWIDSAAGDALIGRPAGRIDEGSWEAFLGGITHRVGQAAEAKRALVLDLADVDYMSSRGLRVLTIAKREADARGVALTLARPGERMREILAISRYDKVFAVTDSLPRRGRVMRMRFWGTRGSLPVASRAEVIQRKIARALVAANGRRFADEAEAMAFAGHELDFATGRSYGGATACVEIEGAEDGSFIVCDMGSGLRDFGIDAARAARAATPKCIISSCLTCTGIISWASFFGAAFDPGATIVIHGGHPDLETALRRQQQEISFPVPFDALRADIRFVQLMPGETYRIAGLDVTAIEQCHSHLSYGYRFGRGGETVIFSTDAEHRIDDMENERAFEAFFAGADIVVCDTMYSLADSVTMKADWGHSSNLVAVDLCHAAGAGKLVLFHHEPTYSDHDILRMHEETIRYEEINRQDRPPLSVVCAYDGLELDV